uniref:C2H2-type domain-containing protein n=1 Tax=Scophthalmus maximus TaxID=52904 RepID=A0A8D3AXD1_SCOMX
MFAVQLLRVSVHERIGAAAEDFLLQVEKGEEAARVPALRALLTERLTAAAEEIVGLLEETVAEYEDRVERSEREICRQRRLLDAEVWTSQEGEQVQGLEATDLTKFTVKSEEEKPQSSQFHPSQTEETRVDCGGPETARNSGPDGHLETGPEDQTENSSETDDSEDWKDTREPSGSMTIRIINVYSGVCDVLGTGEKPFCCSECGKPFGGKEDLKRHMRIHTGEKPFNCSVCGKRFRLKGNLQQHMMIHTKKKPFSCTECCQRYRHKGNLQKHVRLHTGEKRFSCRVCNKSFTWKYQQKKHQCLRSLLTMCLFTFNCNMDQY